MLKKEDYEYLLTDSGARALVTTKGSQADQAQVDHAVKKIYPDQEFQALFAAASPEADPYLVGQDDIAFWLYSSGSTGKPKGAPHKQISMLFTADNYAKNILDITENDVHFSVSKLFFAYGLGNNLSFPFRFGASAVLLSDPPLPEKVLETILKFRPTLYFGVPTHTTLY